jgi:hypothetical protein
MKANALARGGLYTALSVILMYFSIILPTNKLSILTLVSAVIPLSIITTNLKNSILVYVASSIIALILGFKGTALAYLLFFGLYGIIKYYIERIRKLLFEIILKLAFFNLSMLILYFISKTFLNSLLITKLPIYFVIIAVQIAFILYDYALTTIIAFINKKLS